MALDPSYFFYSDGTITLTNGSDIATGNFTAWDPAVLPFDFVFPNDGQSGMSVIEEVLAMDQIRLAKPWTGPTLTDVPYFMVRWTRHTDPRIYAVRVSDYLARLKAIPDNIEEVAGEINADRQAVDAAMTALAQIQANVDADRQAAETAAGTATGAASAAAGSAQTAQQWAEAASSGVLPDNGVTNAKLADMPTGTIKGRVAAGTGDPQDLTASQIRGIVSPLHELISKGTIQAVPQGDIALPGTHSRFLLVLSHIVMASDAASLLMRLSTDGTTFRAGATDYVWAGFAAAQDGTTGAYTSAGAAAANVITGATNDAALVWHRASITLHCPVGGETSTLYDVEGLYRLATSFLRRKVDASGTVNMGGAARPAALRLLTSGGNISNLNWALFGMRDIT